MDLWALPDPGDYYVFVQSASRKDYPCQHHDIFIFIYFTVVALSLVVRGICYSAFSDWAGSYYPVFAGRYPWELYF